MLRRLASVGGYTLLSRIAGFVRDIIMAAVLGDGFLSDAFFVAWRLPNSFRNIFAEGAFNVAFIPRYAAAREKRGEEAAARFADNVYSWQIVAQLVLLVLAIACMTWIVRDHSAGVFDASGSDRACDGIVAHHVPIPDPDRDRGAAFGDAQRAWEVRRRRGMVDLPQSRNDRDVARRTPVSQCRLRRGKRRAARGLSADRLHRLGGGAQPFAFAFQMAALEPRDEEFHESARRSHLWIRQRTDPAVLRHTDREFLSRRADCGQLRRPDQPASARHAGDRAGDCASAGDVDTDRQGRRERRRKRRRTAVRRWAFS